MSNSEPNPVSERQIDQEIVELHMRTGNLNSNHPSLDNADIQKALLLKSDSMIF